MEILVLSSLARRPMHGYEIKLELRYKHVRWWAKCEHGHLYSAITRLERGRYIRALKGAKGEMDGRGKRVFTVTSAGRKRLEQALEAFGVAEDATYFDIDLFLQGAFSLDQRRVLEILGQRAEALRTQLAEAEAVRDATNKYVPVVGKLIIDHRVDHLRREVAFAEMAAGAIRAEVSWGAYLGVQTIEKFIQDTGAPLEAAQTGRRRAR